MTTSVDVDNNRIDHHPDGIQEDFAYDFQVNYQEWMMVFADGIPYEEVFTMTGIGEEVGGLVQYTGNPPDGSIETLTLIRTVPLTQTIVYPPYGPFPAKSHEGALDKLTWITQQMQEELDRCLKVPIDDEGAEVTLPSPEALKTLMWNEAEDALINGPSEGDFQGWLLQCEFYATQAIQAATDSAVYRDQSLGWMSFANLWATADINVPINDGVNPVGFSAYHWAQMASEGGIIEITSEDTEMMQVETPLIRFRNIIPIHGTPGGMVKLDGNALVPFDQIPFDGALRLLGIYAGHDNCPKADIGVPESPCLEPDSRNPSQRWPSLVPNFGNGDYFIITQCEEPPTLNHIDLLIAGETVPIVTEVFNGDGIVYIADNALEIQSGWYHVPGMANRGNLAQNVIFDDTFTTVKGENVQLWNQNLDQLAAQEAIRRDGTIPMIADLDFPAESGIRGWGNVIGGYLDLLLTNAIDEAVLPTITHHDHVPTLDTHVANKNYVDNFGVPPGAIIMWSGTLATIPPGWALCDGTLDTPNLLDKFITQVATAATEPGDEGGSKVISVAQMPVHGHTATVGSLATGNFNAAHTHTLGGRDGGDSGSSTSFRNALNAAPTSFQTSSSGLGNHSHPVTGAPAIGNAGSGAESLPPFFALAFIMKL